MNSLFPLSSHQKALYATLRERLDALRRTDESFGDAAAERKARLLEKYPEARRYALFALLSEDGLPEENGLFDFPAPDSIEAFINNRHAACFGEREDGNDRLSWLDQPLQLERGPQLRSIPKCTIAPTAKHESPFHVEVKEKAPPPRKSLAGWLKRPFARET